MLDVNRINLSRFWSILLCDADGGSLMVLPSLSLLMAFASGFGAGLFWERSKLIALIIFVFFILVSAGLLTVSFQVTEF